MNDMDRMAQIRERCLCRLVLVFESCTLHRHGVIWHLDLLYAAISAKFGSQAIPQRMAASTMGKATARMAHSIQSTT